MRKILTVLSVLVMVSCANDQYFYDPQAAFESVECEEDAFRGGVTCVMPEKNTCSKDGTDSVMSCGGTRTYSKLKVRYNKSASIFITGYVFHVGGWIFPHSATDISGKNMRFEKVDSQVGACAAAAGVCQNLEYFVIYIDRNYIRSHLYNGITIQIYGQRGKSMLVLPPAYVQGFDAFLRSQGI